MITALVSVGAVEPARVAEDFLFLIDLMILGQRTFFHRSSSEDLDTTLKEAARYSPRPVALSGTLLILQRCTIAFVCPGKTWHS